MLLTVQGESDPIFSALPVPLKYIGTAMTARNRDFASATQDALHARRTASALRSQEGLFEVNSLEIGEIKVVSGRTTPMQACMGDDSKIVVNLCYSGVIFLKTGGERFMANASGLLVAPNNGGALSMSHLAGVAFSLDRERLRQTVQVLCGTQEGVNFDRPFASSPDDHQYASRRTKAFFNLFDEIDLLLQEDQRLPAAMGLDDQIYRLVSLKYIARHNLMDRVGAKMIATGRSQTVFDELVGYIETHAGHPLSLTDLEQRSHYSGRQLQNLFRERFGCSPMQFVKRQRLTAAMEQLQQPEDDATVTSIARGCGYHDASSFSSDFQRQFGVCPSAVLRSSRGGGRSTARGPAPQ